MTCAVIVQFIKDGKKKKKTLRIEAPSVSEAEQEAQKQIPNSTIISAGRQDMNW